MRLGYQRLDLGHLADRERFASHLLHDSRRSFVKCCADKQYGVDRNNNCVGSTKQYRLCVSYIGHSERQEKLDSRTLVSSFVSAAARSAFGQSRLFAVLF